MNRYAEHMVTALSYNAWGQLYLEPRGQNTKKSEIFVTYIFLATGSDPAITICTTDSCFLQCHTLLYIYSFKKGVACHT